MKNPLSAAHQGASGCLPAVAQTREFDFAGATALGAEGDCWAPVCVQAMALTSLRGRTGTGPGRDSLGKRQSREPTATRFELRDAALLPGVVLGQPPRPATVRLLGSNATEGVLGRSHGLGGDPSEAIPWERYWGPHGQGV